MHSVNKFVAGRPPLQRKIPTAKKSKGFQCPGSSIAVDEKIDKTVDSSPAGGVNEKTH